MPDLLHLMDLGVVLHMFMLSFIFVIVCGLFSGRESVQPFTQLFNVISLFESNTNTILNEKEVCLIRNQLNLYFGRHFQLYLVISFC
jgi:hypothetical protein